MSQAKFQVGQTVKYETLDEEYYSRGYGCIMETKRSQIVSICYKLANGDIMEERKLVLIESKSDSPKITQNGLTG